jgi:hypothetical protein
VADETTAQKILRLRFDGRHALLSAAVALLYFGMAKFGLLFAFATKQVTAV